MRQAEQNASKNVSMFEMFEMSANLCLLNAVTTSFRERDIVPLSLVMRNLTETKRWKYSSSWLSHSRARTWLHVRGRDLPLRTYLSSDLAARILFSLVSEAGRTFANLIYRVWVSLSRVTRLVTFLTCDTCYITFTGHWDWGRGGEGGSWKYEQGWDTDELWAWCCQQVIKNN